MYLAKAALSKQRLHPKYGVMRSKMFNHQALDTLSDNESQFSDGKKSHLTRRFDNRTLENYNSQQGLSTCNSK